MNVGTTEGTVRLAAGAVCLFLSFLFFSGFSAVPGILLNIFGIYLLGTGFFNYCLIYKILGRSSKK